MLIKFGFSKYTKNSGDAEAGSLIFSTVMLCILALVPYTVVRGLIIAAGAAADMVGLCHFAQLVNMVEHSLLVFMPLLMNVFISINWAGRNNFSLISSITISLCALVFTNGIISGGEFFVANISMPLAIAMGLVVNIFLEKVSDCEKYKQNRETRIFHLYHGFLESLVLYFIIILIPLFFHRYSSLWVQHIYPDNFWNGMLYLLLRTGTWFFGVNGNFIFIELGKNFSDASYANLLAWQGGDAKLNILSTMFYETWCSIGGSGGTLSLLICMYLRCRKQSKHLVTVSLPMSLLNMNEPLLFGIPIVLNPVMFIPFLLTPVMSYIVAWNATVWGVVPAVHHAVSWTVPPLFNAWLSTNSWAAVLLQLFIIIMGCLIYYPFWIYLEKRDRNISGDKKQFNLLALPASLNLVPSHHHSIESNEYIGAWRKIRALQSGGEFILWFQPQVCLKTRRIIALETLLRYQSAQGKILPPTFLKYYSRLNMLPQVDFWVLEQAINHIHDHFSTYHDMTLSINISPPTLMDEKLFTVLDGLLKRPLPKGWTLEFEITETDQLSNSQDVSQILENLHQRGVQVALDDFGSGYSTLSYLTHLSLDKIKLDRSLVLGMSSQGGVAFFNRVVSLCQATESRVLVEGIETHEEAEHVRAVGISLAQGYFFHRPLPVKSVCELLDLQRSTPAFR